MTGLKILPREQGRIFILGRNVEKAGLTRERSGVSSAYLRVGLILFLVQELVVLLLGNGLTDHGRPEHHVVPQALSIILSNRLVGRHSHKIFTPFIKKEIISKLF